MGKGNRRSGFVLGTVLLLLLILIFFAASLFKLIPTELNYASRVRQDTEAYYAATAGIKHCLAWLETVADPARPLGNSFNPPRDPFGVGSGEAYARITVNDPAAFPLNLAPTTQTPPTSDDTYFPGNLPALRLDSTRLQLPNDWTSQVTVFPDKWTPPHPYLTTLAQPSSRPPCYTIVSVAFQDFNHDGVMNPTLGERFVLRVECSVVQGTFARYAYFVDEWVDAGASTIRLNLPKGQNRPVFAGPVHTNAVPILRVDGGATYWNETTAEPSFGSDLSFAGKLSDIGAVPGLTYDGIAWYGGNFQGADENYRPYSSTNEPIAGRYERAFSRGENAIRYVDRIELPADSDRVALAAWGHTDATTVPGLPPAGSNQVFVRSESGHPKGGVVVSGGVKECLLDVLNNNGVSVCNTDYNSPVPNETNNGNSAIKFVQEDAIIYASATQNAPLYGTQQVEATGIFFETQVGAGTPADGVPVVYNETIGTTTREVTIPLYGTVTVSVPDGAPGGGPVGGGGTTYTITGYTTTTRVVPLTEPRTRYDLVTGPFTGTYLEDVQVQTGTTDETLFGTYNPTDVVVEAKDLSMFFVSSYLGETGDLPLMLDGETAYYALPIQTGQVAVIKQSRGAPDNYEFEILDGYLNGAVLVEGDLNGLRGWNKGPKTFQSEIRTYSGPGVSTAVAKDIVLTGPLRQFGVNQGDLPAGFGNELGLIGRNIQVNVSGTKVDAADPRKFYFDPGGNHRPLYVYAALLALGGKFQTLIPGQIGNKVGQLDVIGSIAQKRIGLLYDAGAAAGWFSSYRYDPYLNIGPPPAFPVEASYEVYFFRVSPL